MKANELLESAAAVLKQRGEQNSYDKKNERSMADVVRLFVMKTGVVLSEADGWEFMICLKEVRLQRQRVNGGDMEDTLKDLLGYHALKAECLIEKAP